MPTRLTSVIRRTQFLPEAREDLKKFYGFLGQRYVFHRNKNKDLIEREPFSYEVKVGDDFNKRLLNSDVILLFGSNDIRPAIQAVFLYNYIEDKLGTKFNGLKIVTIGKGGHTTVPSPVFPRTEAQTYADILRKKGIPGKAILVERFSTNTEDNITKSYELLGKHQIYPIRPILVQSAAAQLRTNLVFEASWPDKNYIRYISYPITPPNTSNMALKEVDYHLAYALREFSTLVSYSLHPRKFQTSRILPEILIKSAIKYYNKLKKLENWRFSPIDEKDFIKNISSITELFRGVFTNMEAEFLKTPAEPKILTRKSNKS